MLLSGFMEMSHDHLGGCLSSLSFWWGQDQSVAQSGLDLEASPLPQPPGCQYFGYEAPFLGLTSGKIEASRSVLSS